MATPFLKTNFRLITRAAFTNFSARALH